LKTGNVKKVMKNHSEEYGKSKETLPFEGRCEKIQAENEIGFPRCPGNGKIRAAKIGGIRKPVQ